jgi:hypothetical protein|tara:strand:- start:8750 stop:9667 length:918 start_codon:yes stop_codon:yes gene_type:complete
VKNAFNIIFILVILAGCSSEKVQESISIQAELDTTMATIGDVLHFSIKTTGSGTDPFTINDFEKQDAMEIRRQTVQDDKSIDLEFVFWDTGTFSIPALDVVFLNADLSEKLTLQTDQQNIVIVSSTDPTSAGTMKPVKDPLPVFRPVPMKMIILFMLILISLLVMAWLSWKYKKERLYNPPENVLKLPDEVAEEKLKLLREKMENDLEIKDFYVEMSYILREYVEHSLFVKTLEMTTEDIRLSRDELPYSEEEINGWLDLLERADLTKYAKMLPHQRSCDDDIITAELFVRSTIPYWKQVETPRA